MQVIAPTGQFRVVLEDKDGSIYVGAHYVVGWAVDDNGDVTPLTINGLENEAVGVVRPSSEVELFDIGEFGSMGDARLAWLDKE